MKRVRQWPCVEGGREHVWVAGPSGGGHSFRHGGAEIRRVTDASRKFSLGLGRYFWQIFLASSTNAFSS